MIKAVIFDMGGVLVKWKSGWVTDDLVRFFGKEKKEVVKVYELLIQEIGTGKITEKEFWRRFVKELKLKKKLTFPKESLLLTGYKKNFARIKATFSIVEKLRKKGYKLAILSDTNSVHATFSRKMKVFEGFDAVVLSYQVGFRKPQPQIYKIVLKKLKIKPIEGVFIDDVKEFVEAARKLGLKGVHFKNAYQLERELKEFGVKV